MFRFHPLSSKQGNVTKCYLLDTLIHSSFSVSSTLEYIGDWSRLELIRDYPRLNITFTVCFIDNGFGQIAVTVLLSIICSIVLSLFSPTLSLDKYYHAMRSSVTIAKTYQMKIANLTTTQQKPNQK